MKAEITITENGEIILNGNAFALLKEPTAITLLYNEDKHIVGMQSSDKGIPPKRQGDRYHINARRFFRLLDISVTDDFYYNDVKRWPRVNADGSQQFDDDALFIDISDIVDESNAFHQLMRTPPVSNGNQ